MSNLARRVRGEPLSDDVKKRLLEAIETDGVPAVSERTRVSVTALCRAAGGIPILPGTALLIKEGLREMRETGS